MKDKIIAFSDRVQAKPSTGRLGFSGTGFKTAASMPIQSRAAAISPNGMPH